MTKLEAHALDSEEAIINLAITLSQEKGNKSRYIASHLRGMIVPFRAMLDRDLPHIKSNDDAADYLLCLSYSFASMIYTMAKTLNGHDDEKVIGLAKSIVDVTRTKVIDLHNEVSECQKP